MLFPGRAVLPVKLRRILHAVGGVILSFSRIVLVTSLLFYVVVIGVTLTHRFLNFCPFKLMKFRDEAVIPVLYGYVWTFNGDVLDDLVERANRGEFVIASSCIPLGYSHVCPYCPWPARFECEGWHGPLQRATTVVEQAK